MPWFCRCVFESVPVPESLKMKTKKKKRFFPFSVYSEALGRFYGFLISKTHRTLCVCHRHTFLKGFWADTCFPKSIKNDSEIRWPYYKLQGKKINWIVSSEHLYELQILILWTTIFFLFQLLRRMGLSEKCPFDWTQHSIECLKKRDSPSIIQVSSFPSHYFRFFLWETYPKSVKRTITIYEFFPRSIWEKKNSKEKKKKNWG